ncbi:MAG: T9SS type A sorting domain-containing protein [Paludibacteraceae bacterium]|nr:T9SS type A sorting domain-containing protein [Paludibacteraceae bacterium]
MKVEIITHRLYSVLLLLILSLIAENIYSQSEIWVGSWSCAPYAAGSNNIPPAPFLANNTLRQIVRVSIGGNKLRLKFSNKTCSTPVTMNSVNIAAAKIGSSVDAATITTLKFNRSESVTMSAFSTITSDPVDFDLTDGMRLAITIYYGQASSSADMTSHVASRTDSYILAGDHATSADFVGSVITAHWFHINTIDVLTTTNAGCVAVLGNSITDGYGLSGGLQNRWTDIFSHQLLNDTRTEKIGVLNLGIGGTNLTGSNQTTGSSRFNDDILSQTGLRWVVIFYGTNDIAGGASAKTITDAYKSLIDKAHEMNIKVYGATITPFKGHTHYSDANEIVRNTVNEWIRTADNFDAFIDFDKAIRDPNDITKLQAKYSNDWLHPNVAGYELLGKSVSLDLFTDIVNNQTIFANAGVDQVLIDHGNKGSCTIKLNGTGSSVFGGNIESYVWSKDGSQIATGETPTATLTTGTHTITLTVSDKAGNTDYDEVIVNIEEDSGVWLEAECGTVGSLWNIETDDLAAKGKYVTIKAGNNSTSIAPSNSSDLLSYTFDIEKDGTYNLSTRLLCPTANDDSFWIKMDNDAFVMWNGILATTWQWHRFTSGFSLSKGTHTLTIGYREDGAKLDKIWIANSNADLLDEGTPAANCNISTISDTITGDVIINPNPVKNELNITLPDSPAMVSILNSNGNELFKQHVQNTNFTISMANYTQGIYLIKITIKNNSIVKTIVKE